MSGDFNALASESHTVTDGVRTRIGFIHHAIHPALGITMPPVTECVSAIPGARAMLGHWPSPVTRGGRQVYALPGGGKCFADGTLVGP